MRVLLGHTEPIESGRWADRHFRVFTLYYDIYWPPSKLGNSINYTRNSIMVYNKAAYYILILFVFYRDRGWVSHNSLDWTKYQNRHSSKSIWLTKLVFCQNNFPIRGPFWQKNSFITQILFELFLFLYLAQSR